MWRTCLQRVFLFLMFLSTWSQQLGADFVVWCWAGSALKMAAYCCWKSSWWNFTKTAKLQAGKKTTPKQWAKNAKKLHTVENCWVRWFPHYVQPVSIYTYSFDPSCAVSQHLWFSVLISHKCLWEASVILSECLWLSGGWTLWNIDTTMRH